MMMVVVVVVMMMMMTTMMMPAFDATLIYYHHITSHHRAVWPWLLTFMNSNQSQTSVPQDRQTVITAKSALHSAGDEARDARLQSLVSYILVGQTAAVCQISSL